MEWSATKRGNKKPNNSGLKELHWTEADLETRPKGDKGKVKLAQRVRKKTIMTLEPVLKFSEDGR